VTGSKLTVVLSQAQGKNPAKRELEGEIAAALMRDPDVDVSLVPHLHDMSRDHSGMLFLRSIPGDLVVLAWLYPRATRWILDRNGVKGRAGVTLLKPQDEAEWDEEPETALEERQPHGIGAVDAPDRKVYCIDLRTHSDPLVYLDEIRRIAECGVRSVACGVNQPIPHSAFRTPHSTLRRRWYPVIDYDRCTNCMECIDFCLFGVYGLDNRDRILVEEQDNCKKGCPACSRVCPENAILFPGHKTPAIAGADGEIADLKINLSKLFGAPSAVEIAAGERDAELLGEGREAVRMAAGAPNRQTSEAAPERDELDDLIDGLDDLNL